MISLAAKESIDEAPPADFELRTRSQLEQVEANLRSLLHARVRDLRIALHGSGIILRGDAFSFHAKQLALHGVMQATELPVVRNEIRVI